MIHKTFRNYEAKFGKYMYLSGTLWQEHADIIYDWTSWRW